MDEIGKPVYWDLETHIKAIIGMIRADEIQIALTMIEAVPAWYRSNPPIELLEIKKKIYRQHYDIFLYSNDEEEANQTRETAENQWTGPYCYPRGEIITNEVKRLNEIGKVPWIFDLSCSHGNLGAGLLKSGAEFRYLGKSMNSKAAARVKEWLGAVWLDKPYEGQETILVSTEALEHAWDPQDIVRAAYKMNIDYDQIFLSTPLGCLGGGLPNWDERPLGHIRGWNQSEFMEFAHKGWPGYQWMLYESHSQVLHGKNK